jgi:hypothetical protein
MIELIFLNSPYRTDRVPQQPFYAIKYKGELHPFKDKNEKEIFIYGAGRIKIKKQSIVSVPLYSKKISEWNTYLNEYGKRCLYYSLTGDYLGNQDCCMIRQQQEFGCIVKYGPEKFSQFALNFNAFQKIQRDVINALPDICLLYSKDMHITPRYSIVYSFLTCAPYMDAITDDKKLENTYIYKRKHELRLKHPLYSEFLEIQKERDGMYKVLRADSYPSSDCFDIKCKYDELERDCAHLYDKINADLRSAVSKEIETGVFPVCMKDRMSFLFGEEAAKYYINCMNVYSEEQ